MCTAMEWNDVEPLAVEVLAKDEEEQETIFRKGTKVSKEASEKLEHNQCDVHYFTMENIYFVEEEYNNFIKLQLWCSLFHLPENVISL